MIHSFYAENFYSIGKRIEVTFESKEKAPDARELYLDAPFGNKISKVEFIGGPNAGGKSNILRVLAYLRFVLVDSITFHSNNSTDMCQFMLNDASVTKLGTVFSIGDSVYYYDLELDTEKILREILHRKCIVTKRATKSLLFERSWNNVENRYSLKVSKELNTIKSLTSLNELADSNKQASFISIFANFDVDGGILKSISDHWRGVISNMQVFGSKETNYSMIGLSNEALKNIYENGNLNEKVTSILKKYDIGFDDITRMMPQKDVTVFGIRHSYGSKRIGFSMDYESSGTQRLIILLEAIMNALSQTNGVAVIDELDAFLHPDIYDEIISLFTSENTNPNDTQLIFSAQNYSVLSKLDKQQIILAEKNRKTGETEVWRLDDINGINSRDNFYLKYLTGAYGGVPAIG